MLPPLPHVGKSSHQTVMLLCFLLHISKYERPERPLLLLCNTKSSLQVASILSLFDISGGSWFSCSWYVAWKEILRHPGCAGFCLLHREALIQHFGQSLMAATLFSRTLVQLKSDVQMLSSFYANKSSSASPTQQAQQEVKSRIEHKWILVLHAHYLKCCQ